MCTKDTPIQCKHVVTRKFVICFTSVIINKHRTIINQAILVIEQGFVSIKIIRQLLNGVHE